MPNYLVPSELMDRITAAIDTGPALTTQLMVDVAELRALQDRFTPWQIDEAALAAARLVVPAGDTQGIARTQSLIVDALRSAL